jgi:hypothetical protein
MAISIAILYRSCQDVKCAICTRALDDELALGICGGRRHPAEEPDLATDSSILRLRFSRSPIICLLRRQNFFDVRFRPGPDRLQQIDRRAPERRQRVLHLGRHTRVDAQGHVGGKPLDVFVAGDNEEAKATVARLVEEGNQRVFDAGPLRPARQLDGLGFLNILLQSSTAKPWMSSFKIAD